MRKYFSLPVFIITFLFGLLSFSGAFANGPSNGKFSPGEMILDHVKDEHAWHLWGETHVPLPVILKTEKGIDVFSSGNFFDGEGKLKEYKTELYTYAMHEGHIKIIDEATGQVNEEASDKILDFSITKAVVSILLVAILMLLVFFNVAKAYKRRPGQSPRGLQSFIEPLIMFVRDDVAKPSIGKKHEKFMPWLLTVFFFIFFGNLVGLIPIFPFGANMTGNPAVTATLAVFTMLIVLFIANRHYWRHIFAMPGVPIGILIILTPIEIMGFFLRPLILMIRLLANITAGHIIALAFFSLIFIFGEMNTGAGYGASVLSVLFAVFMGAMELLVAFLQAYVFTLLSAIYFGSAIEEHHHEEHGHEAAHAH